MKVWGELWGEEVGGTLSHFDWMIFALTAAYGACMGSFLNVVILRLPEGRDLIFERSRCAVTGKPLHWYENIPIISWVIQGGKSRYSGTPISVQYPLVEAFTMLAFAGLYLTYYMSPMRAAFANLGVSQTWPVLITHLALLSGLIAATVIDARLFIIPLQIPYVIIVAAMLFMVGGAVKMPSVEAVAPVVGTSLVHASIGGTIGLLIAIGLLWVGIIPYSVPMDEEEMAAEVGTEAEQADVAAKANQSDAEHIGELEDGPDQWLAYPYPRRMVMRECLFLALPVLGAWLGYALLREPIAGLANGEGLYPLWLRVLGGILTGYLGGAGLVWGVRILGTLGFGKEAMGLGDVHLVGAIGAVLGWRDAVLVFFIAPFIGLGVVFIGSLLGKKFRTQVRVIPYGPYLAIATAILMFLYLYVERGVGQIFP